MSAGLGAVVFLEAIEQAARLLLGGLGGYTPPHPAGDGGGHGSDGFDRAWAIALIVAFGGLMSGVLVTRFAPEAEGHGTDAAIERSTPIHARSGRAPCWSNSSRARS